MSKLNATAIQLAEYARQVFRVTVPKDVPFADLAKPEYWAHVAAKFTQGDKIEALAEDGSWYAELYVRSCSRVHAQVVALLFKELVKDTPKSKKDDALFSVEFKGPQRKWSVIRKADKEYIKDGFVSDKEALQWLDANRADIT